MALPHHHYVHRVCFNDLGIPYEPIYGYAPDGSWGVRRWTYVGMPRLRPEMERCVLYLRDDDEVGGTAFVVSRKPSVEGVPRHWYAVTAAHVTDDYKVLCPSYRRPAAFMPLRDLRWVRYPDDKFDLAVADITEHLPTLRAHISHVDENAFATEAVIGRLNIGVGDEVCMVGLYDHDSEGMPCDPAGRFGAISRLAQDGVLLLQSVSADGMVLAKAQPSHLVDMRSRSGFSGSPVFVYRTPVTNLKGIADQVRESWDLRTQNNLFIRLLGVHRAQFHEHAKVHRALDTKDKPIKNLEGAVLDIDDSMTAVIPAWEITTLLNEPELADMRKKRDDAYEPPKGKTLKSEAKPKREDESNPDHHDDFKRLLRAGVKSPKSSG